MLAFKKKGKLSITDGKTVLIGLIFLTVVLSCNFVQAAEGVIPLTGFDQFDNMYQYHMNKENTLVSDIMMPVDNTVFTIIQLEMRIMGIGLLAVCITSAVFSIWYVMKPEFADEVSEIKERKSAGETIPFEDIKGFFFQFCPDIKANSGIAGSYEYERPTFGLFVRDHLMKFILLFAVAIALQQSTLITFIVKSANALAFGASYYTENVDFRGMVETWTTAGKDYPVKFDSLTTKGQNQKKLYNAIYTSLKKEKPRDRTEEFLGRIGSKTQQFVEVTAASSGANYDYANFIVNVFITSHKNEVAEVSDLEIRMVFPLAEFGILPEDNLGEKFVYVSIMQYDSPPEGSSNPYSAVSTYAGAWENNTSGIPVKLNVHTAYYKSISDGYKFTGNVPSMNVTVYYSDSTRDTFTTTGIIGGDGKTFVVNLSEVATKLNAKRSSNSNISLNSISLVNISAGQVQLSRTNQQGKVETTAISNTATWNK